MSLYPRIAAAQKVADDFTRNGARLNRRLGLQISISLCFINMGLTTLWMSAAGRPAVQSVAACHLVAVVAFVLVYVIKAAKARFGFLLLFVGILFVILPEASCVFLIVKVVKELREQRKLKNDPRLQMCSLEAWMIMLVNRQQLLSATQGRPILQAYIEDQLDFVVAFLGRLDNSLAEKKLGQGTTKDPAINDLVARFSRIISEDFNKEDPQIALSELTRKKVGRQDTTFA